MRTPSPDYIGDAVKRLLTGPDAATAVIAGNNRVAVNVLRALAHAEHRPAMVGFDDFELADLLPTPVTVVRSDPSRLGDAAASLAFARLDGDERTAQRVIVPTELVRRGSGEIAP